MSARLSFTGKFEFGDDESVQLDCGCVANPGDAYERHCFMNGNTKMYRTCCINKEECTNNIFYEVLRFYKNINYKGYTELECMTAVQESERYADDDE